MNDLMTKELFDKWRVKYYFILAIEKLDVVQHDEYYDWRLYNW